MADGAMDLQPAGVRLSFDWFELDEVEERICSDDPAGGRFATTHALSPLAAVGRQRTALRRSGVTSPGGAACRAATGPSATAGWSYQMATDRRRRADDIARWAA
jgi:hypothetical protein